MTEKTPLDLFSQQCGRARDRNKVCTVYIVTPEQAAARDREEGGPELVEAIQQVVTSIIFDRQKDHRCFNCMATTFDASRLPHSYVVAVPVGVPLEPGEKLIIITYAACAECARTEDLRAASQKHLWPTTAPRRH